MAVTYILHTSNVYMHNEENLIFIQFDETESCISSPGQSIFHHFTYPSYQAEQSLADVKFSLILFSAVLQSF